MKYHEVFPKNRIELQRLFDSGSEEAIIDALLSAVLYDGDWKWVQAACLRLLDHPAKWVRWNAVTCLGHLARNHRIDTEVVIPRHLALREDSEISPNVDDALEDMRVHLRSQ